MNTTTNGTTAAQVNASESNNRRTQYDEVTKIIRISFEHDGRITAQEAREYVAGRVSEYANAHGHTIDEGMHILNVESEDPEPQSRPTFAEIARDEVENRYNDGDTTFTAAVSIAEAISKAVAHTHGKGNAARYMLDTIAHYVQSHCNPALEEDGE
jgi:hypothetical protein